MALIAIAPTLARNSVRHCSLETPDVVKRKAEHPAFDGPCIAIGENPEMRRE